MPFVNGAPDACCDPEPPRTPAAAWETSIFPTAMYSAAAAVAAGTQYPVTWTVVGTRGTYSPGTVLQQINPYPSIDNAQKLQLLVSANAIVEQVTHVTAVVVMERNKSTIEARSIAVPLTNCHYTMVEVSLPTTGTETNNLTNPAATVDEFLRLRIHIYFSMGVLFC
jgi:hypothetical protein